MSDPTKPDLTAKTPDDQVTYGGWSPLTAQDIANWTPGLPQTTGAIGCPPGLVIGPGLSPTQSPIRIKDGYSLIADAELVALRADKARLDKAERIHLSIDYEDDPEDQDTRAEGDPWVIYADATESIVLGRGNDLRAAIDNVSEDWMFANPRQSEGIW